jgi:multiple sugar transport system permease protein
MGPRRITWVAGDNYRALFSDPQLRFALTNSAIYTAMNVPAQLAAALGLAMLIRRARRMTWWITIYYAPHALAGVATILIWWWLLNPQVGPVNRTLGSIAESLRAIGIESVPEWSRPLWLYSPALAKPSLVLMNLWHVGGGMLIFLAALLRGGDVLLDAARVDGASCWRRFWHVTLPLVSPAIFFNALTGVIYSMQEFDQPFLLFNYQQGGSLQFYSLYLYQIAFEHQRFGYASAVAVAFLGAMLVIVYSAVLMVRRWVHYQFTEGEVA